MYVIMQSEANTTRHLLTPVPVCIYYFTTCVCVVCSLLRSQYNTSSARPGALATRFTLTRNDTVHPLCLNAIPHLALPVAVLLFTFGAGAWPHFLSSSCPCAPSLLAVASSTSGDDVSPRLRGSGCCLIPVPFLQP